MNTFDFSQVGKKMPYRTPEGFFDAEEQKIKNAVRHHTSKRLWVRYTAVVAVLILVAIYPLMYLNNHLSQSNETPVYVQIDNTQGEWTDFAEADIFLENMDW